MYTIDCKLCALETSWMLYFRIRGEQGLSFLIKCESYDPCQLFTRICRYIGVVNADALFVQ